MRPLVYSRKNVRNPEIRYAAFDSETEGLGGKLLSVQCGAEQERNFFTGAFMLDKFFSFLYRHPKPYVHYAHFAQYDWRYILDFIQENEIECRISLRTERDIYEIRVKSPTGEWCIMRDSYALCPVPLVDFAKSFCPEFPKLEIDVAHFNPDNPDHRAYAMRDIEILLVGLPRFSDMLNEHFDIRPGPTTASTALKAWQHSLGKNESYFGSQDGEVEEFIRSAYYGGLVFLTTTRTQYNCRTYDINSSYPGKMERYYLPDGIPSRSKNWKSRYFGIYKVRVRSPENLVIPIIPARGGDGGMRWYSGEFDTICTNIELIFAAKHGYEILEIYDGLIFPKKVSPFADFIGLCKRIRKTFPKQAEEAIAKLMQNSLYGKFGTKRERMELFHPETQEEEIGAMPFDLSEYWFTREKQSENLLCKPEWAAFITAYGRLHLIESAYQVGIENVFYGDTDSLTIRAGCEGSLSIGQEYGQFKLEREWKSFRAIAPKVYTGDLIDGAWYGKAKGMPKKSMDESKWLELFEEGKTATHYESLPSLYSHIKKGSSETRIAPRSSTDLEKSVNFFEDDYGNVRPRSAKMNHG